MSDNVKKITVELSLDVYNEIQSIKENLHLNSNGQVISKLVEEFIGFDADLKAEINKVSKAKDLSYRELVTSLIKKSIDKELKGFGFVKEKHKKTAQAEEQLLEILRAAVEYYDNLPDVKDKVYLSPSAVHKFILMNDLKQKNMGVIKRFLAAPETDFVRDYHNKNQLRPKRQGYNAS